MSINHVTKESVDESQEKQGHKSECNEKGERLSAKDGNIAFTEIPLSDETTCGVWICKGQFLQKFANKKTYVFIYGLLGCATAVTFAYFNGTITTLEKRFKIPSRNTGIITIGNDLSQLLVSFTLSYYAGRRHKPRWMALGLYTVVLSCLVTASPHFFYGSGEDALMLTVEYGATFNDNTTLAVMEKQKYKTLCHSRNATWDTCELGGGSYAPQILLFTAQFISGIGGCLYYTLGLSYMDDNIKKSKTPALISLSFFLRMLGPAFGHALASGCLKLYVAPSLTPTINNSDPRWIGAWWLGWIIVIVPITFFASLLALFPKTLPRAAARKLASNNAKQSEAELEVPTSFEDMVKTFKRIIFNPTLMLNNFAAVFYFLGYMPYWIFLPKYIESQYRQSASASNMITGTTTIVFSAIGVLLAGLVISKYKPRARYLAAWNVIVGAISVVGIISYTYLGCTENDNKGPLLSTGELNPIYPCNAHCACDYVKYGPVCSQDGKTTFISACHAGCQNKRIINNTIMYTDCSCVPNNSSTSRFKKLIDTQNLGTGEPFSGGNAYPGSCFVDCVSKFNIFLIVVCILKFSGATGRASNFLVTIRCVDEKDKPVAMGLNVMFLSLCAFIPSPILFGVILDNACLVWGQTCSGTGNCWLYNGETLRYTMNFTAAAFVTIGTLLDVGVWYTVKGLKIFEEEPEVELHRLRNNSIIK